MGVLKPARHFFVRLYGLSGKAVVIDEAHAYDTYTSELLENLLLWLSALRVPVVLLSATLPEEKREKLLRAYAPRAALPPVVDYPCALAVQPSCEQALYAPVPWSDAKTFTLDYRELDEGQHLEAVELALRDLLAKGGCALCMTNTVDEAQALYAHLDDSLDLGDNIHLFHARFPMEQRLDIEERMKRLFGKDPKHRPERAVLVATQVAEQSLDADFDLLISHLAPIDLLFQRMGRVHRHGNKQRPSGLQQPRVICLGHPLPSDADLVNINLNNIESLRNFVRLHFGMSGFVYSPEVLLKSALVIREKNARAAALSIPTDIQPLIAQVYGPETVFYPEHLGELIRVLEDNKWIQSTTERREAKNVTLPRPDADELLLDLGNRTLDDEILVAQTRLGRLSITLIPLHGDGSGGWFLDAALENPVDLETAPNRFEVERLIRRGVSIAKLDWVAHFKEQEVPKGWQRSAHLRHTRPLWLNTDREYAADGRRIRMDEALGLVFEG
jgi:CRISPR-associated endonuclease/helicase Cas3